MSCPKRHGRFSCRSLTGTCRFAHNAHMLWLLATPGFPGDNDNCKYYIIQSGDTLETIALSLGLLRLDLEEINPQASTLQVGVAEHYCGAIVLRSGWVLREKTALKEITPQAFTLLVAPWTHWVWHEPDAAASSFTLSNIQQHWQGSPHLLGSPLILLSTLPLF